ncbi:MAG: GDP-mannose 4,6-dehydratase, partial [Candidatus Aureabacteria bacterium]|nr:GDP-mannose 4,6-dehydratase [Candidatus Auribacterota bacterium]
RDFTDVRDMARAYHLAAERCEPGEIYNICSGKAYSVRDILDRLLALSTAKIEVRQDPGRLRRSDVPLIRGDASRFAAATGWKPECDIDDTLRDILDYWRAQVRERQV